MMKITGIEGLMRALAKKQKAYVTVGELAIRRGLEVIRGGIVVRTPVVTGRLKGSISGVSSTAFNAKVAKAVAKGKMSSSALANPADEGDTVFSVEVEGDMVTGIIGTNVPYAQAVEFGTSRFEGRHYFEQGIEATKEEAKKVISSTLEKA